MIIQIYPWQKVAILSLVIASATLPTMLYAQNTFPSVGNVGIGCSNPNASLSVMGSSKLMGELEVDSAVTFQSSVLVKDDIVLGAVRDSALTDMRLAGIDPDGKLGVMGNAPGRLQVLYVDSLLKVGAHSINMLGNSPTFPYNQLFATNAALVINGMTNINAVQPTILNPGSGAVAIGTTTWVNGVKLTVTGSSHFTGNIGVGQTPSNASALGVTSAPGQVGLVVENPENLPFNYAARAIVRNARSKALAVTLSDNNAATADPETFVVYGNGCTNIGDGTPDNAVQLRVGSSRQTGVLTTVAFNQATHAAYVAELPGNDARAFSVRNLANPTATQEVFKVTGQGKVWCQEMRVRLAPFPDYVFAPGYSLPSLDSVEAHIVAYGRLPGFPSADQVEAEGADLGELVRLQQEQIEQLTLHVIALEKRLKEMDNVEGEVER